MSWILPLDEVDPSAEIGGKARVLALLKRKKITVPDALCLPAGTYRFFIGRTGLDQQVFMELGKKDFADMRWEEIWDISLRLRNGFINRPLPEELNDLLGEAVEGFFKGRPVSVRSSALAEDTALTSFAGMHDSFVNLSGTRNILKHIKLVWASLWSDRALLYRRELGLDPFQSAMAVVVQEMVVGRCSGVAFSMNPLKPAQASIEAVYGLNQGLVDGSVEPDHWELSREEGEIIEHLPARRRNALRPGVQGVMDRPLAEKERRRPPLSPPEVMGVYLLSRRLEKIFGRPQDMEWTIVPGETFVLQSRAITTLDQAGGNDERSRYLGWRRNLESLKQLRRSIEEEIIPGLEREAREMAAMDLGRLPDKKLIAEIRRRQEAVGRWVEAYWQDCIPFAHGMRLLGQVYNDHLEPRDPYEFMTLLSGAGLESINRNRRLREMGEMISAEPALAGAIEEERDLDRFEDFVVRVDDFISLYGGAALGGREIGLTRQRVAGLAARFGQGTAAHGPAGLQDKDRLEESFLASFAPDRRAEAEELLEIARASYRLRDDDNIYLGRVEGQLARAMDEGIRRLEASWGPLAGKPGLEEVIEALSSRKPPLVKPGPIAGEGPKPALRPRARQIQGQPAGPGLAVGRARVINRPEDLFDFQNGEVLVCDAIDPNMTFIVPLAAAVVERRGGMLIHGAIIAREHGLPCVTGVPEAASLIKTGDRVTVDGYLGLVTIGSDSLPENK